MSPGDTINAVSLAIAADFAKALAGLATLALVVCAMSLVFSLGGNNLNKMVRSNMLPIFSGILIGYGAAGIVAFIVSSTATG